MKKKLYLDLVWYGFKLIWFPATMQGGGRAGASETLQFHFKIRARERRLLAATNRESKATWRGGGGWCWVETSLWFVTIGNNDIFRANKNYSIWMFFLCMKKMLATRDIPNHTHSIKCYFTSWYDISGAFQTTIPYRTHYIIASKDQTWRVYFTCSLYIGS